VEFDELRMLPTPVVNGILGFWLVLLILWFPFVSLSGMVFDGGATATAYRFVWSLWTYPVSVVIGILLRKRLPLFSLLPVLNVISIATC